MVTYEEFLQQVNEGDMAMLLEFAQGRRVLTRESVEADALFSQATRLFEAGLVWRVVRGYEQKADAVEHQFDGYTSPLAYTYIAQAARERVIDYRENPPTP